MDDGHNLYQWIWLKKYKKISTEQIKCDGKSRDLSQCVLWWWGSKIPNWCSLQYLSQHVTFDQWAHQRTGLVFIIHALSQEPINPVGYVFLIKLNLQMPLAKNGFFVINMEWYILTSLFSIYIYIYKCVYSQKLIGWWENSCHKSLSYICLNNMITLQMHLHIQFLDDTEIKKMSTVGLPFA